MRYLLPLALTLLSLSSLAQKKAITEDGKEVILYNDNTWKFLNEKDLEETKLDTFVFKKSDKATFPIAGDKVKYKIYFQPTKWAMKKGTDGREYEFEYRNGDAYGMVISEELEILMASLRQIVLQNAREETPEIEIVKEDVRIINGKAVRCIQMEGTMHGISVVFLGYYYSGPAGTIQLVTYTGKNLFTRYKPEMEELLNGLVL